MDSTTVVIIVVACLIVGALTLKRVFGLVSANQAQAMAKRGAVLLDVRTVEEFRSGHVTGAINMPYEEVGERIAFLAPDKSAPVLVYCLSGGRSGIAKSVLRRLGYSEAHNLGSLARAKRIIES